MGCSNSTSDGKLQAAADVVRPVMDEHAANMLDNPTPTPVLESGAYLISVLDKILPERSAN